MSRILRAFRAALVLAASLTPLASLSAQSYSPIYAPQTGNPQYFTCYYYGTDTPYPYASWAAYTGAYPATNAHFHATGPSGSTEPVSGLQPSAGVADGYGDFSFNLNTTKIGQAEVEDVACGNGPYASFDYAVGYSDVYYNDHPNIWIKTGATSAHGSTAYNRYMQLYPDLNSGPAYDLYYSTLDYLRNHPGVSQICTNDMALPFGGKFDIRFNWTNPHIAHDRGTAVDIAGPNSGSCPAANQVVLNDMIASCDRNGGYRPNTIVESYVNSSGITVYHVHCNFASPSSYPH